MKTQYFHVLDITGNLYTLKGASHAFMTITPEDSRKPYNKGFAALKTAETFKRPFHKGIVKVSDKGVFLLDS
jgi:hypothetical protein